MNSFVLSVRNQKNNSFGRALGKPSYLEVPENQNAPLPSHRLARDQWFQAIINQATPSQEINAPNLDIVFFVHGYNNSPDEALLRQRRIQTELRQRGLPCLVIGFDWPSAEQIAMYLYDRSEAQQAALSLVQAGIIPFALYNRARTCSVNIHIIAHSMGGFVLREAFRASDKSRSAKVPNDWRVSQLVLFAADISSSSFQLGNPEMLPVFDHCGRLTNYFSGYDQALAASNLKNLDIDSRVGRVGMPTETPGLSKALDVDCGPRYVATHNVLLDITESHAWYFSDPVWYDDLAHTLQGGVDRNLIPTRTKIGENDFVLNKSQVLV